MYFDFASAQIPSDNPPDRRSIFGLNGLLVDGTLNTTQQSHLDSNPDPLQLPFNESNHHRLSTRWRDCRRHPAVDGRRWKGASDGGSRTRRRKRRTGEESRLPSRKNAVMVLKESIPQLQYTLVQATGPCHSPTFTVQTVINGQTYLGCGRTKRKARMEAATRAILSSIQFPDSYVTHDVIQPYLPRSIDFTADSFHDDWSTTTMAAEVTTDPLERSDETASNVNARRIPDLTEVPWNPVSILNDIRPQSRYHRISSPGGSSDRKRIRISVTFDGMTFDGVGRCQRSAKQRAAQAALKDYFNLRFIGSVRPPKALPSSSSNTPIIPQGTHPRAH